MPELVPSDDWRKWRKKEWRVENPYWVRIRWGSDPELQRESLTEYRYPTKAELDAFLDGVDAAAGYLDYEITACTKKGERNV